MHAIADRWDTDARNLLYFTPRRRRRRKLAPIKVSGGRQTVVAAQSLPPAPSPSQKPQPGDHPMTSAANVAPPMSQAEADATPMKPQLFQQAVMQAAAPTAERLSKPHQRVTLKNTSESQVHFLCDRHLRHIEFKPGQSREITMLTDELANLMRLQRSDRGFYPIGSPNAGKPFPPHPVKIIGVGVQSAPTLL
jgi:hypothetical protein